MSRKYKVTKSLVNGDDSCIFVGSVSGKHSAMKQGPQVGELALRSFLFLILKASVQSPIYVLSCSGIYLMNKI